MSSRNLPVAKLLTASLKIYVGTTDLCIENCSLSVSTESLNSTLYPTFQSVFHLEL